MMRHLACSMLVVAVFTLHAAAQDAPPPENGGKNAGQDIQKLIDGLKSRYFEDREKSAVELEQAGAAAETLMIEALKDEDFRVRMTCARLLGKLKSSAAIRPLIGILGDEDEQVKEEAFNSLCLIGDEAFKVIEEEEANGNPNLPKGALDEIVRLQVEFTMNRLITPGGMSGFYEGQFKGIAAIGKRVIPVLIEMGVTGEYQFKAVANPERQAKIRMFAVEALGEFKDDAVIAKLKDVAGEEPTGPMEPLDGTAVMFGGAGRMDEKRQAAMIALYKLGTTVYLDKQKEWYEQQLGKGDNYSFSLSYSMHLSRMRKYAEAEQIVRKLLESNRGMLDSATMNYHMACATACNGKKAEALGYLKKAVKGGMDIEWVKIDGDMDSLRNEPEYKALIEGAEQKPEEPTTPDVPESE
jgi:hypothetical protein